MTSTVTLSWEDPESAADLAHLAADLRRDGWLPDPSRDELLRLIGTCGIVVVEDGSSEEGGEHG